jgi:acid phosphatase (class A)
LIKLLWCCPVVCVAGLLIPTSPLYAADTMADPTQYVPTVQLHYLRDGQPDALTLLAPPPLADSPEQAADMAEVRAVCHAAPSNEVAMAFAEKKFSAFTFAPAIGAFFQSNNLPRTTAFFERVQKDAAAVTDSAKEFFKRPRPFVIDPGLASGKLEKSFSYPSGHATESMVLALVLADLFPDQQEAILAEARAIGWHRVEIARHYPTDIHAGRVLAQAILRQLRQSDAFQKDFAEARAEITHAQSTAKN